MKEVCWKSVMGASSSVELYPGLKEVFRGEATTIGGEERSLERLRLIAMTF